MKARASNRLPNNIPKGEGTEGKQHQYCADTPALISPNQPSPTLPLMLLQIHQGKGQEEEYTHVQVSTIHSSTRSNIHTYTHIHRHNNSALYTHTFILCFVCMRIICIYEEVQDIRAHTNAYLQMHMHTQIQAEG
jgi:hypothetical protein